MLRAMDPQQIALVRASFADASAPAGALTGAFYDRLFAAAPELHALFPADRAAQERKLEAELQAIVDRLDHVDDLVARTRALGSRHVRYGARPAHYDIVGDALLGALADTLGTGFTPQIAGAWRYAYNLVAEAMQQGATVAAPGGRIEVEAGLP